MCRSVNVDCVLLAMCRRPLIRSGIFHLTLVLQTLKVGSVLINIADLSLYVFPSRIALK